MGQYDLSEFTWSGKPTTPSKTPVDTFLTTPAYDELQANTMRTLREQGYDDMTIQNVVTPGGLNAPDSTLDVSALYDVLRPGFEASGAAAYETLQQLESMQKDGMTFDPQETSMLRNFLLKFANEAGPEAIEGMSGMRDWKRDLYHDISASTAGKLATKGAGEVGFGLASLDFFAFLNKAQKLLFVPKEQRAELEARVLPTLTLEDHEGKARQFTTGTTAAWWTFGQRLKGMGMIGLSKLTMNTPLPDWDKYEAGSEILQAANQNVLHLPGLLGENLQWQEVVERQIDYRNPGMVDSIYKTLDDAGDFGQASMAMISMGSAGAEVFGDLLFGASEVPAMLTKAGAPLSRVLNAETALRTSLRVSRRTGRYEDALQASAEAENYLKRMTAIGDKQIAQTGTRTEEQSRRILAAQKQVTNEKMWLDTFQDPGATQPVRFRRSSRRKAEFIPEGDDAEILKQLSDDPVAVEELKATRRKELEADVEFSPIMVDEADAAARQLLGPTDSEQAGDGLAHMIRTGGIGLDDAVMSPQSAHYRIHPDVNLDLLHHDIRAHAVRGVAAEIGITGKNLGAARSRGDKPAIALLERKLDNLKATMKKLPDQEFAPYTDNILPAQQVPETSTPEGFTRWMDTFKDQLSETLYPGSFMLNQVWDTGVGQVFARAKEVLRFFDVYDPKTSEMLRGSYLRMERDTKAFNSISYDVLNRAGILKQRSKWNPKVHFKPHTIDDTRSTQLYDLLNTKMSDPAWGQLASKADKELLRAHDEIRTLMDHAAKLQGLSEDTGYLEGYIRHIVTKDMFSGGARPWEGIGMPAKAEVFVGHLLERKGAQTEKDLVLALDMYGRFMYRKIYLEPAFESVLAAGERLSATTGKAMFAGFAQDTVNHLKGKPSFVGAKMDEFLADRGPASAAMGAIAGGAVGGAMGGAPGAAVGAAVGGALGKGAAMARKAWSPTQIDRALTGLSGMIWAGTLAGNPRYTLMQMASAVATTSSRYGLFRTSKALWQMATPEGQAMAKQIGVYQSFVDILESPAMKQFSGMMTKMPSITPIGLVGPSTAKTEFMVRGMSALAAMDMYLTKAGFATFEEAVAAGFGKRILFESLRGAEETNHMYGALGRSPVLSSFLPKGAVVSGTQFLSFIPKQTEELLSQFHRNPGALAQYLMLSGWMSRVAAQEYGIDLTSYTGLGYLPERGDDLTSPGIDAMMSFYGMLSAMNSHDPEAATAAHAKFLETMDNMVPLMVAWETAGKSWNALREGEQRDTRGALERPLDFRESISLPLQQGDFQQALQNLPGAVRPEGLPGSMGGELLPTMFGQRSIRDELHRRGKSAIMAQQRARVFQLEEALKGMTDAYIEGDVDKIMEARDHFNELVIRDDLRIGSSDPKEVAREAYAISWDLRYRKRNSKYEDLIVEEMDRVGIQTP